MSQNALEISLRRPDLDHTQHAMGRRCLTGLFQKIVDQSSLPLWIPRSSRVGVLSTSNVVICSRPGVPLISCYASLRSVAAGPAEIYSTSDAPDVLEIPRIYWSRYAL